MELLKTIQHNKEINFNKATEFYNQGLYANALSYYFRALNAAEILENKMEEAEAKKGIMFCYAFEREYDQVFNYSQDLILNYQLTSEKKELTQAYKAFALNRKGQFREAEKILKYLVKSDSKRVQFRAHTDLGLLYYFLHRFSENESLDLAFEHIEKAYQFASAEGEESLYKSASNMGLIYLEKGEIDSALMYFEEALKHTENGRFIAQIYNELGRVYALKDDLDKSEEYFEKASKYALSNSKFLILTYNLYYQGLVYLHIGKENNAYNFLHTALFSFLERKHYPEVVAIYKELMFLFQETNPEKAEYYQQEYQHYLNYIDPLGEK
ncbi:MAG: tetratricopeptide repeat protein [Halanaerobiales bacterium]|nr:tetratricopeptide repeat protein [Halanaerobiales bacterium]